MAGNARVVSAVLALLFFTADYEHKGSDENNEKQDVKEKRIVFHFRSPKQFRISDDTIAAFIKSLTTNFQKAISLFPQPASRYSSL